MDRAEPDRLRALVDLVVDSLDEPMDAPTLARRAFVSRYHFDHLLAATLGEAPGRFRRRLLLERAAWRLTAVGTDVTGAAIEAGYGSLEAFTRAFRRAFGTAPTRFRTDPSGEFRLPAPNGVHFHPPAGLLLLRPRADHEGSARMDLTDRLLDHDLWMTRRLIERAADLSDAELDELVDAGEPRMVFDAEAPTVRSMLDRLVFTKEMWTAAIVGRAFERATDVTLDSLRRRLDDAGVAFVEVVRGVRDGDQWDAAFVDATGEPPESFTFGGMVAHVLTFSAARRQTVIRALRALGADDVGIGDPLEWERSLA
jgi:AraC family transcriptional regulator